jgi:hypothetical protein
MDRCWVNPSNLRLCIPVSASGLTSPRDGESGLPVCTRVQRVMQSDQLVIL